MILIVVVVVFIIAFIGQLKNLWTLVKMCFETVRVLQKEKKNPAIVVRL